MTLLLSISFVFIVLYNFTVEANKKLSIYLSSSLSFSLLLYSLIFAKIHRTRNYNINMTVDYFALSFPRSRRSIPSLASFWRFCARLNPCRASVYKNVGDMRERRNGNASGKKLVPSGALKPYAMTVALCLSVIRAFFYVSYLPSASAILFRLNTSCDCRTYERARAFSAVCSQCVLSIRGWEYVYFYSNKVTKCLINGVFMKYSLILISASKST